MNNQTLATGMMIAFTTDMRQDFWYQLSGSYFSWHIDSFSTVEYHDMFYHLYTEKHQ
jgi:hypothetical protein